MTDADIKDSIVKLTENVNTLLEVSKHQSLIIYGDKVAGVKGLLEIRKDDDERHARMLDVQERLIEKVGELGSWKEGIQNAPKTVAKKLMFMSAFLAAMAGIWKLFGVAFEEIFKRIWP